MKEFLASLRQEMFGQRTAVSTIAGAAKHDDCCDDVHDFDDFNDIDDFDDFDDIKEWTAVSTTAEAGH